MYFRSFFLPSHLLIVTTASKRVSSFVKNNKRHKVSIFKTKDSPQVASVFHAAPSARSTHSQDWSRSKRRTLQRENGCISYLYYYVVENLEKCCGLAATVCCRIYGGALFMGGERVHSWCFRATITNKPVQCGRYKNSQHRRLCVYIWVLKIHYCSVKPSWNIL